VQWLIVLLALLAASGSACPQLVQQYHAPLPRALAASPTLEQVIQAVNANSQRIQTFTAMRATLSGPGFPSLRAVVAFERPMRFRLQAETAFTGPEIDLGSNDQLFWFWVRRNQPPAIYYCRHEQFATCPARQLIPIEPQWLVEALGLVQFDPRLPYQGPIALPGDRLEIRAIVETPQGAQTHVTVIDAIHAVVLQQSIYDARGQLVVTAQEGSYRVDPLSGLVMPTVVTIHSPAAQLTMQINLGNVEINRPNSTTPAYWTPPTYPNTPTVDLCDPRLQLSQPLAGR
jgi:hypothetical protein